MKYYIELSVKKNNKFFITKLYKQIHYSISKSKSNSIGISFAKYTRTEDKSSLGNVIRVFSKTKKGLNELNLYKNTKNFNFNFSISKILEVPKDTKHCVFMRMNVKSKSKLLKKYNAEEIKEYYKNVKAENYPNLRLFSNSSNRKFVLYIMKEEREEACSGEFNGYGLSSGATVPDF